MNNFGGHFMVKKGGKRSETIKKKASFRLVVNCLAHDLDMGNRTNLI